METGDRGDKGVETGDRGDKGVETGDRGDKGVETNLLDVLHTFVDVELLLCLLGVVGVEQDSGVRLQGQLHHLPAQLGQVSKTPQQLQDLGGCLALSVIPANLPYQLQELLPIAIRH